MNIPIAIAVMLLLSLVMGAVIGLQWMPQKDGSPPRKPMKQWMAVCLVVASGVGFVLMVTLVTLDFIARQ